MSLGDQLHLPAAESLAESGAGASASPRAGRERRGRRLAIALIKWSLFLIVLAIACVSLGKQFRQIDWTTIRIEPWPIVGAAVCLLLVPPVQLLSYRTLLGAYAHQPPWRVMVAVAWIPPLGKYLPGASWVGAFVILRRFDISVAVGLSVIIAMDGLAVLSGLIIGSPLVGDAIAHGWLLAWAVIIGGAICLHPAVFGRLLNLALVRSKRPPLAHMPDARHYLVPLLCAFAQWVLAGLALWLTARSVASVGVSQIPRFFSIAGLGYTIGYLVLFAPAGVGPRDLIFQKSLQAIVVPAAMSAVAVVVVRIIQTLTELTAGIVGMLVLRSLDSKASNSERATPHVQGPKSR